MSETEQVDVETQAGNLMLPKDVTAELGSIKLFNKWSYEDVEIRDISLTYVDTSTLSISSSTTGCSLLLSSVVLRTAQMGSWMKNYEQDMQHQSSF